MSTARVSVREFKRQRKGSAKSHQALQRAVLDWFLIRGIPAVPIHTGPRVMPLPGGAGFRLLGNPAQRGLSDVMACLPPAGKLALVELKTGQATRSSEQVEMHRRFKKAGALTLVIHDLYELEVLIAGYRFIEGSRHSVQTQGGKS